VDRVREIVAKYLAQAAGCLGKATNPLSYNLHLVGAVITAAMMFLVTAAVIMRYVFNRPILGDLETITAMLVLLISFSLAYCAVTKTHVSVTALVTRLPYRVQTVINVVNNVLTLAFVTLIAWYSVEQAIVLWNRGTSSIIFNIPLFSFPSVLAFGSAVFALVILVEVLDSLSKAVAK